MTPDHSRLVERLLERDPIANYLLHDEAAAAIESLSAALAAKEREVDNLHESCDAFINASGHDALLVAELRKGINTLNQKISDAAYEHSQALAASQRECEEMRALQKEVCRCSEPYLMEWKDGSTFCTRCGWRLKIQPQATVK